MLMKLVVVFLPCQHCFINLAELPAMVVAARRFSVLDRSSTTGSSAAPAGLTATPEVAAAVSEVRQRLCLVWV